VADDVGFFLGTLWNEFRVCRRLFVCGAGSAILTIMSIENCLLIFSAFDFFACICVPIPLLIFQDWSRSIPRLVSPLRCVQGAPCVARSATLNSLLLILLISIRTRRVSTRFKALLSARLSSAVLLVVRRLRTVYYGHVCRRKRFSSRRIFGLKCKFHLSLLEKLIFSLVFVSHVPQCGDGKRRILSLGLFCVLLCATLFLVIILVILILIVVLIFATMRSQTNRAFDGRRATPLRAAQSTTLVLLLFIFPFLLLLFVLNIIIHIIVVVIIIIIIILCCLIILVLPSLRRLSCAHRHGRHRCGESIASRRKTRACEMPRLRCVQWYGCVYMCVCVKNISNLQKHGFKLGCGVCLFFESITILIQAIFCHL